VTLVAVARFNKERNTMITQLKTLPCKYKEIEYRSKTEARVAEEVFDRHEIKFLYEAETYNFDGELYSPDFYLPEIKTFIEVKGATDSDLSKPQKLLKTLQDQWVGTTDQKQYIDSEGNTQNIDALMNWEWDQPFMVIAIFSDGTFKSVDEEGNHTDLFFTKCAKCNSWQFIHTSGFYACRKCGHHDEHHHANCINKFNLFKNQRQYKFK